MRGKPLSGIMTAMFSRLFHFWRPAASGSDTVPPALWQAAETRLAALLGHLTADERQQLRRLTLDFIRSKAWQGAQGLIVTLEMQVEIALQACLLILKRNPHEYEGWEEIIIYPGDFIIPRQEMDEAGVVHEFDDTVLGEAWEGGPLLLSWEEVRADDASNDGINVVIHEFAHKLDMATGVADGQPVLTDASARRRWAATFGAAYADFCQRLDAGEQTAIDTYAGTAPAEFFAVLSEVFFEQPALLLHEYPDVYREMQGFYGQTPG